MARATKRKSGQDIAEIPESDCLNGALHPRRNMTLIGHRAAERAIVDAFNSGRMHHAWLIQGPRGVGKATFAYRVARFFLSHGKGEQVANLDADPDEPAVRQIAARSHPDLFVLRREWNKDTKKLRQEIAVGDVRNVISFFNRTSGAGGWRVAIVDSMDDLNRNSANALLKTLEEPPEKALFLLISNAPGALLPTIRSRCRKLVLAPLEDGDVLQAIAAGAPDREMDTLDEETKSALLTLAKGSPGQAVELLQGSGLQIHQEIGEILSRLPAIDYNRLHALAAKVGKRGAEAEFALTLSLLRDWIANRVAAQASDNATRDLTPMATAWEKIGALDAMTGGLNLDRRRALIEAFNIVAMQHSG